MRCPSGATSYWVPQWPEPIRGTSTSTVRPISSRPSDLSCTHPRQPEELPSDLTSLFDKMLGDELAFGAQLDEWLARRKKD